MNIEKPGLPFEGFISYLRRQGFIIGVDHHLRLQEMLNKLGPGCEPAGMKYLLCPIFAVNEKQQQQFYRAFDLYFKPLEAAAVPSKEYPAEKPRKKEIIESPEEKVTPPKWQYILGGILLVILAIVIIFLIGKGTGKKIEDKKPVSADQPAAKTKPVEESKIGDNKVKESPPVKPPEIKEIKKTENEKDTTKDIRTVKTGDFEKENKLKESLTIKDIYRQYRYILQWVGLLSPFIIFLLIEGYKYNRRCLILVRQRGKKPPLVWPIKVEAMGTGFLKNDWFFRAARFLRKRIKSGIIGLDLEKTISGTIEHAGFPTLRYKFLTRPRDWSWKEIVMAGEFIVVPATLEGLCALEDHWEKLVEPGLKTWKQADEKFPFLSPGREEQVEELQKYLGKDAFQWLCACAVYPELHWDLTLYLGTLPSMPGNILNEENVLRLLHLPWFHTGTMPDELRWELISRLDTGISRAIRTAIVELLEKNPAPTGSVAYDTYRLHLAVQRWMLSPEDREKRKAALKSLKNIGEKPFIQDYIMLRFLETAPSTPLHFVLPKRLRKLFYSKGVPFFGIKTGIRVVLTILIAINLFLFFKDHDFSFNKIIIAAVVDLTVLIAVVLFLHFKDYESDKPMDIAPAIFPAVRTPAGKGDQGN